ncbi:MAG: hypothetical protein OEW75_16645, partial [Cyclobacteriaceae bacterium]|nr:hypothetical protein [Cyclobacteriaceae bacterium]
VSEGGGVLFYQGKNFQVGVNLLLSRFSAERKPGDDVYNFHQISGSDFINHSIYGNFKWRGKLFFGELARSNSGRMALIYGGLFPFSKKADFMFLYRNYEPGYFSLHGKAFGENSVNQNEKGLYVGFKYKLSKWVSFSTNSDIFYFPWVSYQSSKPYSGFETRLTGEFKFKSNSLIKLRYRVERKMSDDVLIQKNTINTTYWNKHQFMFHFSYKIHSNLEYRLRIQTNRIITGNNRSSGYLTYNELIYNKSKIQLAFRYCNFQIDNYENREYVYEKDLEYAFSLPAFQDTGYRFYTFLKLKASRHITGWLKYGIRRNNDPLENFYQNRLIFFQDLKIQFRYKL